MRLELDLHAGVFPNGQLKTHGVSVKFTQISLNYYSFTGVNSPIMYEHRF